MVPDDGSGAECDHAAGLLQTPAKIHVITGRVIFRIEPTDIFESPPPKRHLTTRNVFGAGAGQEAVTRPTGRRGDTSLDPRFSATRNLRTTHAREVAVRVRSNEMIKRTDAR